LLGRVDAATAHELANLVLHHRDRIHDPPPVLVPGARPYPPPARASTPDDKPVDRAPETA
jgi:hypothetical protein